MKNITIQCDRCGKLVDGQCDENYKMTAGFYDVTCEPWNQFARWEELLICDECMYSDLKYIKNPITSSI